MQNLPIKIASLLLLLLAVGECVVAQAQTPDSALCKKALGLFAEAQRVCDADGGELWGENIWGSVLLVRDSDKLTFTNDPELLSVSQKIDSLYCGILDSDIVVAGSAIRFKNSDVAVVPMFTMSDSAMMEVFVHELFHRFQNQQYNMSEVVYDNAHVDTKMGRTLVLCELLELSKALSSNVLERKPHIERALAFRKWRWALFPDKSTDECRFEFQEGLALYTQYRICFQDSLKVAQQLCQEVERLLSSPNLSRQYGYNMGAMYACLNDIDPTWRQDASPSMNLSEMAGKLYGIDFSNLEDTTALKQSDSYLRVMEGVDNHEFARQQVLDKINQALQSKSVVYLRTDNYQMGFNPACVLGLDELGNYFAVIELKGDFGTIYSEYCCLISNQPILVLPSSNIKKIKNSPEFSIELNKGWRLRRCKEGYEIVIVR
ncbi:MAG: hypothetical protein J6P54_00730 [Bacteroidales bacterium]|nr:hypothetical protein [Bacteroidales bacterium]